jgi:uncharacterized protein YjcR
MNQDNGTAYIQAYTVKQLAEFFGVSEKIFKGWIRDIKEQVGVKSGHYYNLRQVEVIFNHMGIPAKLKALYNLGGDSKKNPPQKAA